LVNASATCGRRSCAVGGESYLQAEERGDDPEADDDAFGARQAQVHGREGAAAFKCHIHVVLLVSMTDRAG
jgi:hypothetical protein